MFGRTVSGGRHRWRSRASGVASFCWSIKGGGTSTWLLHVLFGLVFLIASVLTCEDGVALEDCCQHRMQQCWQLYETAQEQLGVPDHLDPHQQPQHRLRTQSSSGSSHNSEQSALCLAFRTYYLCLKNISCTIGDLSYHAAASIAERTMNRFNCSRIGQVYKPRSSSSHGSGGARPSPPLLCPYTGERSYHYCALFGDPHLRAYDGSFQTCRISGAWPLIDNEHFTIQVTSEPIGSSSHHITALAQVTVMLKKNEECGSTDFVTYEAQRTSHLPSTFEDGRSSLGPQRSVMINRYSCERHKGECVVELHMRHINTTIVIRKLAGYLSVAVVLPQVVANSSSSNGGTSSSDSLPTDRMGIQQLCMAGCPRSERFTADDFVSHKHSRLKMHKSDATDICADSGATDGFYDACIEDLLLTGNEELAETAYVAQADMMRLYPDALRFLENRTVAVSPVNPSPSSLPSSVISSGSSSISGRDAFSSLRLLLTTLITCFLWTCYPNR